MDFRQAILALKKGEKIRRTHWPRGEYLRLVRLSEQGPLTNTDTYVEATLGIASAPVVTTRIDRYDNDRLMQERWMAQPDDMQGEWQLWVQYH